MTNVMPSLSNTRSPARRSSKARQQNSLQQKKLQNAMPQGIITNKRDRMHHQQQQKSKQQFTTMHINHQEKKELETFFTTVL
jgi:hypothetical protein